MSTPSIEQELDAIRRDGLWRSLRALEAVGGRARLGGRAYLNFASNGYLGLADHDALKAAATEAVAAYGCGATSSRLLAGNLALHEALEDALARLCGKAAALVFPSGYQANIAVLTALAGKDDVLYSDALNHASIIDGCRLSRAAVRVYPHNHLETLEGLLQRETVPGRRVVVSDTLFSMDGDPAPLRDLARLARDHGALLVLDEAHALGVFGAGGGLARAEGVEADAVVGTLSKSLGSGGGFVAGTPALRDLLVNRGRTFIYTTGLSPANTAAALAACGLLAEHPEMGATLLDRSRCFHAALSRAGVPVQPFHSPIIPVMLGDNGVAVAVARALFDDGILAPAIRPPTVPPGTARLRLSVTLDHDEAALEDVAGRIAAHTVGST